MSDVTIELARVIQAEKLDGARSRRHHGRRARSGRVRDRLRRPSSHTSTAA